MGQNGDTVSIDDVTLRIWPGCLAVSTEITLRKLDLNAAFESLLYLGLVNAWPQVVDFRPDGLKFLKPADLTITVEEIASESKMFILHGFYKDNHQKIVWEKVNNEIKENTTEGVVNMKIDGFCFYCYFVAVCKLRVDRFLSHVNRSFICCAYAFYRRRNRKETIDISIVLVSEFIDENWRDIKQIKDHIDECFIKSDKGFGKRICTDKRLKICLTDFSDFHSETFSGEIDQCQVDKNGFVVNQFNGSLIKYPARGNVKISMAHPGEEDELLWKLNIDEMKWNAFRVEEAYGISKLFPLDGKFNFISPIPYSTMLYFVLFYVDMWWGAVVSCTVPGYVLLF